MRQLISSLVKYNKITTTEAKAKALKREIERLISRSKKLDLVVRRRALAFFSEKATAEKFLRVVAQFKDRVGGYVRVVKLPNRLGDRAPMALVEFVEEIKGAIEKEELVKAVKGADKKPAPQAKPAVAKKPAKPAAKKPTKTKAKTT